MVKKINPGLNIKSNLNIKIWDIAHMGQGPYGPVPIWAKAHMGPGPLGPGPFLVVKMDRLRPVLNHIGAGKLE